MITNISVLNTVKDNAADFYVDANGFLNITGCPAVKAKTAKVTTTAIVAAQAAVATVTFTAVNSYTYNFRVAGYDATNNRIVLPFSYTTAATGATATTIATAVAAMINASPIGAQFASVVGGATLVMTATTANPLTYFFNYNNDTSMTSTASANGTAGIEAQGYGADLLVAYGGFIGGSSIVATNSYTQHEITLTPDVMFGGQAITEWGSTTYIVLVNASAVTGGVDNVAVNIALINNATYGTAALLKAGYRAALTDGSSSTCGVTATTGAIALAAAATSTATGSITGTTMTITTATTALTVKGMVISGTGVTSGTIVLGQLTGTVGGIGTYLVDRASAATGSQTLTGTAGTASSFPLLNSQSGDYFVISTQSAVLPFDTIASTKVTGITGASAGFGTNIVAVTAASGLFKYIAVRNIAN